MKSSSEPSRDSESAETLPTSAQETESGMPISDSWDSEAPTTVHSKHPLFAGPPRLPST